MQTMLSRREGQRARTVANLSPVSLADRQDVATKHPAQAHVHQRLAIAIVEWLQPLHKIRACLREYAIHLIRPRIAATEFFNIELDAAHTRNCELELGAAVAAAQRRE